MTTEGDRTHSDGKMAEQLLLIIIDNNNVIVINAHLAEALVLQGRGPSPCRDDRQADACGEETST